MQGDFILHQRIFGPKRDTWVYHYKIFRGKNFELLILDVMREEVDGIALAKGIRERCVKSLESFLSLLLPKGYVMILIKVFALSQ